VIELKVTMYKWIALDKCGEIVSQGIEDECIELDVDMLHRNIDSCCDRDMWDIQDYLDKNHKELGLTFKYKNVEIDFSDLKEE